MNNFWNLTGYEYKKIFRKKSTLITVILAVFVSIFSCYGVVLGNDYYEGKKTVTKMESMQTDRDFARALTGRNIDSELMMETVNAYAKVPTEGQYSLTEEYQNYARPYSEIFNLMQPIFSKRGSRFELSDFQMLSKDRVDSYYGIRDKKVAEYISIMQSSDTSKANLIKMNEKVKTPFVFEYTGGYERYIKVMFSTGIITCLAIAILISPIFSGEYACGADQLILSSKHGKNKLIFSKLFTAITISGGFSLLIMLITYLQCMLIYGFDGTNAPFQLFLPLSVYPLTMGQVALVFSICNLFATLLISALTMLLSSKMKTPFGVIIIIFILIIVPMFFSPTGNNVLLSNLLSLLPTSMMAIWNVISHNQFEVLGLSIPPYIFMPIFSGVVAIIAVPLAFKGFKNHQIG